MLVGWAGLLVPSLIRSIEHDFGQTDAGVGLYYFLYALFYAAGGMAGAALNERRGRHVTFPIASLSMAVGLLGTALAPTWPVFLAAAAPFALGGGAIDSGVNGLFLELHPGRGGPLNLLHLNFSIGALAAPLAIGVLVESGVAWPVAVILTALVAIGLAWPFAVAAMPSGRHRRPPSGTGEAAPQRLVTPAILLLGVAIGCYVAEEIGTSSWIVRFLADLPVATATASLSLFWAGLAAARLLASRAADRYAPVPFAALCALGSGIALAGAVLVPNTTVSIALFGLSGFFQGPIYPMIMSIAGTLQPGRSSAVSGILTMAAVIGGLVYPPAVGVISVSVGIGAGLLGAAVLGIVTAVALVGAGILSARAPAEVPEPR